MLHHSLSLKSKHDKLSFTFKTHHTASRETQSTVFSASARPLDAQGSRPFSPALDGPANTDLILFDS